MKKLALLAAALMLFAAVSASAETTSADLLAQMNGQLFEFSSGVGAWSTELLLGEDGAFTGSFHDSEMGETGEGYPDGTLYGCAFHGRLSDLKALDEYTWAAKIEVEQDEGQVPEAIEDGIRYVTTAPYGLEKAQTVTLYLPGTPVESLPEGFIPWSHLQETAPDAAALPYFAIWSEADEAGFIADMFSEAQGTENAEAAAQELAGRIENGSYVLDIRLAPDDSGEWRADGTAQEGSGVKLAASGVENGVFTVRYEPAGDGEATIFLRHINAHGTCDKLHSFILLVKDGAIQEVTGGSYQTSPAEEEINPCFSGEWLEKDTQFTTLDVTKKAEDGWDIVLSSPVSHGAWVIRATAYYDCEANALVCADGVRYDLVPGDGTQEKEAAAGLHGTLALSGEEDAPVLVWRDAEGSEITFERFLLPAYSYTGSDPIEGDVANMLATECGAEQFLTEPGYVTIPCPILHKTETVDDTHARVYGSFWILNYVKRGEELHCISGKECPAVITLEKTEDAWRVTAMEEAGFGEDYQADIRRFANGDKDLEDRYSSGSDLDAPENREIRIRYILDYVEANGLAISAYRDYGWDAVSLR